MSISARVVVDLSLNASYIEFDVKAAHIGFLAFGSRWWRIGRNIVARAERAYDEMLCQGKKHG